jgi:hypothetical protein
MTRLLTDCKINHAVSLVSQTGLYQSKLFRFLCVLFMQIASNALISPMVFTNPLFTCRGSIATESFACQNLDTCTFTNSSTGTFSAGLYC